MDRKYNYTLGELLDRLTITSLKEVFIVEHKKEYADEIKLIMHDIDLILKEENVVFDADMLRALVVLSQYNLHIWHNESACRSGNKDAQSDLVKTHTLNGVRSRARNIIQNAIGGRVDLKTDCLAAEFTDWEPSW